MGRMSRYDVIFDLIDEVKPRSIIEIGVARAVRAKEMSARAMRHHKHFHYIGYDVFDSVGEYNTPKAQEFHKQAHNHKRVESRRWCLRKLQNMAEGRHSPAYPGFTFRLIEGRTQDTLHGKNVGADLVFIDGDHRTEVIRADYAAVRSSKLVIFDDYFIADERGCPDTEKFGCNKVLDDFDPANMRWEWSQKADPCADKGKSQLLIVWRR